MYMNTLLISSFALLVTACSSSQKTQEFEEYLATHIRNDGSKEFYYMVTMTNPGSKNVERAARTSVVGCALMEAAIAKLMPMAA